MLQLFLPLALWLPSLPFRFLCLLILGARMSLFDPRSIAVSSGHFIGGRLVQDTPRLGVLRPSDGQMHADLPLADASTVDAAVQNAWQAWRSSDWARRAPRDRARVLRRWADLIDADVALLAPLEAVCSTRPVRDATAWDVPFTAEGLRFFAEYADKLGGDVAATRHDHLGMVVAEPYGVVGAITPWNFPLVMMSWKVGAALAAGNAVVLKPSEMTPFSAVRLAELAVQAGVPAGLFNVVRGDGRITGDALTRHPLIAKMTFTGSTRTGAAIMASCALQGPKPVTLELGGKSPQIIFDDADLDAAIPVVVNAIVQNSGQTCSAGSRVLIQQGIYEPLLKRLGEAFGRLQVGSAAMNLDLGPLIRASQLERVTGFLDQARADGIATVAQGQIAAGVPAGGFYQAPTLLRDVPVMHRLAQEEVFGPVLSAMSFTDEDHAVELANATEFGLVAGIWTRDGGRQFRMAKRVRSGQVFINNYGAGGGVELPFGGVKSSGYGREKGFEALLGFTTLKTVAIQHG